MILELLLTAGAEVALTKAISAIAGFIKQDRLGRLLLLLYEEYGAEADLERSAFLSWRTDDALSHRLLAVATGADGELSDESKLAEVIAPHLVRCDDDIRKELSRRMSEATREFAPLVVAELPEATQLIVNRVDASTRETTAAVEGLKRAFGSREHEESLAEALLSGPLDHARARSLIERSQNLAEDDKPAEAAELMLQACGQLDEKGLDVLSETYRARAGELLVAAGDSDQAATVFQQAALGQLTRGSSLAESTIRMFARSAGSEDEWRVHALQAKLAWMADTGEAESALRTAAQRDPEIWLAELVDLLTVTAGWNEILQKSVDLSAITDASRLLRAKLGRAEALAATGDPGAEEYWATILAAADSESAEASGLAYQRRALRLAFDDRPEEAQIAYREAMKRWRDRSEAGEQLAESYYGALAAAFTGALPSFDQDVMPVAAEMRGSTTLPAARAERLEYRAMAQRLSGRLREALLTYGRVLWIHRLSGSLMGLLATEERYAELLHQADRPKLAVAHYLSAGKAKEAANTAKSVRDEELEEVIELSGPGWERAATYYLIQRIGGSLSEDWVEQNLSRMLEDAEGDGRPWLGPDPRSASRAAIAAVALQVPDAERERVYAVLEAETETAMPDGRRAAGRALVLGTNAGLWDASMRAVELFLAEPQLSGVEVGWVAERLADSTEVRKCVMSAAKEGSRSALEAAALSEVGSVVELSAIANGHLERVTSLKSVEHKGTSVSIGMGTDLSDLGLFASVADSAHAEDLASRLLDLVIDPEEPEMHRASGTDALLYMIESVEEQTLRRIVDVASPLAVGNYEPSPWDQNETDPLSAFRVNMHKPSALQATALRLVASAEASLGPNSDSVVPQAVEDALTSDDATVLVGGLEAARVEHVSVSVEPIVSATNHPDPRVRRTALRTLIEIGPVPRTVVERLLDDESPAVRRVLLEIDTPAEDREWIRGALRADPHAYLRALARS